MLHRAETRYGTANKNAAPCEPLFPDGGPGSWISSSRTS